MLQFMVDHKFASDGGTAQPCTKKFEQGCSVERAANVHFLFTKDVQKLLERVTDVHFLLPKDVSSLLEGVTNVHFPFNKGHFTH
jgi:hypothetical protein